MKIFKTIFTILLFTPLILVAQDEVDMTQYTLHQPFINTAASGMYENMVVATFSRFQWVNFNGAPAKYGVNFIYPFQSSSAGATIQMTSIGIHKQQTVMGNYSYRLNVKDDKHLSLGLSGGVEILTNQFTDINTTEIDDILLDENKTIIRPDFSVGAVYFTPNYYVGMAIPSLIYNNTIADNGKYKGVSKIKLRDYHYYLNGGYQYNINNVWDVSASTLVKMVVNAPIDFDLNLQALYNKQFGFGVSYRTKYEFISFFNLVFNNNIKFGYSYHAYFGNTNLTLASHELMVVYSLNNKIDKQLLSMVKDY